MAPDKPQKLESRREEVDLETQFILRLPEEYAHKVRTDFPDFSIIL
jgi:hypothetical protein